MFYIVAGAVTKKKKKKRNIALLIKNYFGTIGKMRVSLKNRLAQPSADSQHFTSAINMVVQNIQKFKEQLHICDPAQQHEKGSQQSK